ncbi:hypothetical protein DL769_007367 [Monosporascus sp. CRB-8-3]|nr:hypothetical protein DL769_007367 [Monosporascus sp. CRB-8-3]
MPNGSTSYPGQDLPPMRVVMEELRYSMDDAQALADLVDHFNKKLFRSDPDDMEHGGSHADQCPAATPHEVPMAPKRARLGPAASGIGVVVISIVIITVIIITIAIVAVLRGKSDVPGISSGIPVHNS